jgi:hypothetical protein
MGGQADPDPIATTPTWVELRVHGVSGTLPQGALLSPDPICVYPTAADSGDVERRGTFWRIRSGNRPAPPDDRHRILEAYRWGDFTSGNKAQSLYILLLPFGIVNAAQFMLPAPHGLWPRWWHTVSGACLRVIAVTLTCLLVFSIVLVAMDDIAWRAIGDVADARYRWLALFALAPFGVLMWLRVIGNAQGVGKVPVSDDTVAPQAMSRLADPHFYDGDTTAPALRLMHVAVATAMLAILAVWPAAADHRDGARACAVATTILLALLLVIVVLMGDPEGSASPRDPRGSRVDMWHVVMKKWAAPIAVALAGSGFVAALSIDLVAGGRSDAPVPETMPGIEGVALALLATSMSAAVILFVATLFFGRTGIHLPRGGAPYRRYASGLAAPFAAAVGTFVGVAYAGGFAMAGGLIVTAGRKVFGDGSARWFDVTDIVKRIEYAWSCTLIVSGVLGLVLYLRYRIVRDRLRRCVERDFARPDPSAVDLTTAVRDRAATAMYTARLKNLIPWIFAVYAGVGVLLSAAAAIDQHLAHVPVLSWFSRTHGVVAQVFAYMGVAVLVLIALGVIAVSVLGEHFAALRRGANVTWDVISFWPRSVHPFVPVAYSQFVVAQLDERITDFVDGRIGDNGDVCRGPRNGSPTAVMVAPHSQGSLITFATLLWLPRRLRASVGLVSYGSQLRQMFGRAFPAYVNANAMEWVWSEYGRRWRNLYRDTDYMAGPVLSWRHGSTDDTGDESVHWPDLGTPPVADTFLETGTRVCGPEWRIRDPEVVLAGPTPRRVTEKMRRHSDYYADQDWNLAVDDARGVTDADRPASVPAPTVGPSTI